jgi:hypothetical protein
MNKLTKTFMFVDNEAQAQKMCEYLQANQNSYRRKNHKPCYTPWDSSDGKEHKFVVWYVM